MRPFLLLPLTLLLAAIGIAVAWTTRFRRSALWAGLGMAGHAATLQLTEAGPVVSYQHLRIDSVAADSTHLLLGAILFLQAVLTAAGLWQIRKPLFAWVARHLSGWRLPALLLGTAVLSAAPSRETAQWGLELVAATLIQWIALGTWLLVVWHLPIEGWSRLRSVTWGNRGLLALAAGVFAITVFLSLAVYQRHPHVPDEVGFLMQAEYMAEGKLSVEAPPVGGAFGIDLMTYKQGHAYSPLPPGWPAVLAIGVAAGTPWLVNPLLAALNVVLIFLLVSRLYDRETAWPSTILYALAPWNLFLAMSFMSHTFAMTCALLATLGIARARDRGGLLPVALAGMAVGMLTLIRPLDGLIMGFLLGLWSIGLGGARLRLTQISTFVIMTALVTAINFGYNSALTGNPALFPVNEYFDQYYGKGVNNFGFGANRGLGWVGLDPFPGHGARDVVVNSALNLSSINVDFLGWVTGSLVLAMLLVIWGKLRPADRLMIAAALTVAAAHAFYWFSGGPDFGGRYWYFMAVPLTVFTIRAGQEISARVAGPPERIFGGILVLVLGGMLVFLPWRAVNKYYHYRGMQPGIRTVVRQNSMSNALVLIQGRRHPDISSAIVYNPVSYRDSVPLFAWDRSAAVRDSLFRLFPDRDVWLVQGPSMTANGYRVTAGPCRPTPAPGGDWSLTCPSRTSP